MPAIPIRPGIYWIGVNDRKTDLFEGLWPITQTGVSYNSYLIVDEKTVLVDLAKDEQVSSFLEQVYDQTDPSQLDYIVVNRDGELDEAVDDVLAIMKVEHCRVKQRRVRL